MKLKSLLTVSSILLFFILGAGAASGYISYRMGEAALKGVSQPEDNPTRKLTNKQKTYKKPQTFKPIKEQTILTQVYNQIYHYNKTEKKDKVAQKAENSEKKDEKTPVKQTLPLATTDQDVTLKLLEIKQADDEQVLLVNLTNDGTEAVRFLYSFLEVKDDEGQDIGVIVEGLPEMLPANRRAFEGVIRIPMNLVAEKKTITLKLTDYPQQKRQLTIKDIPLTP